MQHFNKSFIKGCFKLSNIQITGLGRYKEISFQYPIIKCTPFLMNLVDRYFLINSPLFSTASAYQNKLNALEELLKIKWSNQLEKSNQFYLISLHIHNQRKIRNCFAIEKITGQWQPYSHIGAYIDSASSCFALIIAMAKNWCIFIYN